MSTKTTFKRVALVAVAGLGLGLLSSVSAQAGANDISVVTAQASVNGTSATATQIAGASNFITYDVELAASSSYVLSATGGVATCAVGSATSTTFTGNGTAAISVTTAGTPGTVRCTTPTTAAGTITVDLFGYTSGVQNSTRSSRLTITVTVAPVVSTTYSTVQIASTNSAPDATTNLAKVLAPAALSSGASVQAANILVTIKDQSNVAFNNRGLTATISGPGLLGISADVDAAARATVTSGRAVSITSMGGADNTGTVTVWNDGTAGVATVTVSSGTTVLATKTITFYGAVTKLTATQNLKVARASATGEALGCSAAGCSWDGTAANTPAVYIAATDANGNPVPGLTITSVISDALVIASSANTQDNATAGDGAGYYNASVTSAPVGASGASATVTFRTTVGTTVISSDPVTFTLGGSVRNSTISLNKATYEPGEAMIVTRTATDSSGNPVFDGASAGAVTFSKLIGGSNPGATEYRSGTRSTSATAPTVFAPSFEGSFIATFTGVTDGVAATKSTTAVVTDLAATVAAAAATDAASEATDAANAATDAANAAAEAADAATAAAQDAADAVAALSVQVAEMVDALKKQITALTNLVIKIQKKVKA